MTAHSLSTESCFVLLDDAGADQSIECKQSRLYTGFIQRIDCTDATQLISFFDDVLQFAARLLSRYGGLGSRAG